MFYFIHHLQHASFQPQRQYVGYKERKNTIEKQGPFIIVVVVLFEKDTGYIIKMITFCLKIISRILVGCFIKELLFCEQLTDIHQKRKEMNKLTS